MRFTTLASTTAAIGITAALALGGATTAHATTPDAPAPKAGITAQGDRLIGQAIFNYRGGEENPYINKDGKIHGLSGITEARLNAATISIPAYNTYGKIMMNGQCFSANQNGTSIVLVDCSSDDAINVLVDAGGYINYNGGYTLVNSSSTITLDYPNRIMPLMPGFVAEPSASSPVAVTGPVAGSTVDTVRPVVSGTGEPGATVTVTTQAGKNLGTTTVAADGTWTLTPNQDITSKKPTLTATQDADGETTTATVSFTIDAATGALTATIDSVDSAAHTATMSGTGTAGDIITITGPDGDQTVTVGTDGTWTATVPGLADGDNTITVTDGTDTLTVTATIMPSPIINPMIAGGTALAALLALGTTILIRRKTTI